MEPLSLSFIMAGGASLGAFHGGALAALLTGLHRPAREGVIRIDAMGGTSAGAFAALLAAHAWLEGRDPVRLMEEAWVERLSVRLLRARSGSAPLSFEALDQGLDDLLAPTDADAGVTPAQDPLGLHTGLVNLHGLNYTLPTSGDDRGTTYDDWATFVLQPGGGVDQLRTPEGRSPLEAVFASAANPAAFAPTPLDRSQDADAYAGRGVEVRGDGVYWYTDGETMSAEPVGRVAALARTVAGDRLRGERIAVVLNPRSAGPTDGEFIGDEDAPTWLAGLARLVDILPSQAVSTDLWRIATRNRRLAVAAELTAAMSDSISPDVLERLEATLDRSGLASAADSGNGESDDAPTRLRHVLQALAGVEGQEAVHCEQISPRLLDPDADIEALLSGELMGDFAGFVDQRLRRNDFLLGWNCAEHWLDQRLAAIGVEPAMVEAVRTDVAAARPEGTFDADIAGSGIRSTALPLARALTRVIRDAVGQGVRRQLRSGRRSRS